jgi:hypothetical protein
MFSASTSLHGELARMPLSQWATRNIGQEVLTGTHGLGSIKRKVSIEQTCDRLQSIEGS